MENENFKHSLSRRRFIAAAGASAFVLPRWSFAQQGPIKIGFPTPLTSPYSIEAQHQVNGATLAVEEFNLRGGVLGRKIELLARDDQLKPGMTAQRAKELIEKDQVDFMSGALSAHVQMAVNSQTKPAKMVYISISQANAITAVPDWSPWTFHEAFSPHMTTQAGGSWAIDNLGKRIFILYADYALGHDLNAGLEEIAKAKGATIVGKLPHVLGNPDFSAFIPKIMASRADVLMINNYGKDQLNAVKDMHNFGVKKRMKIFFPLITFTGREDLGPVPYEEVYGGASFYWELAAQNESARRFVNGFQKRFNRPPGDYAGYAYSASVCCSSRWKRTRPRPPTRSRPSCRAPPTIPTRASSGCASATTSHSRTGTSCAPSRRRPRKASTTSWTSLPRCRRRKSWNAAVPSWATRPSARA
jgi:branched-chain amino acid transport system substrate-binding protein